MPGPAVRSARRHLFPSVILLFATMSHAAFNPPKIVRIAPSDQGPVYFIDRGLDANIKVGDVLNVYREKRASRGGPAVRLFIGTMKIRSSRTGSAMGHFTPNEAALSSPVTRHRTAMKSDTVVPIMIID